MYIATSRQINQTWC